MSEYKSYYTIKGVLGGAPIRVRRLNSPLSDSPKYLSSGGLGASSYVYGRDAFDTAQEALSGAEALRVKKIASLEKQIAKLRKMTFTVEDAA